ncbi:Hypothetical protein A7982_02615 [Minicystis rosea]|nr:Hypothetical protein A7982_02615 [Minicystis rosea]
MLGRGSGLVGVLLFALSASVMVSPARADDRIVLFADRDDDDANGVPDREQPRVPHAPELVAVARPSSIPPGTTFAIEGDGVRLLADGIPLATGGSIPPAAARLELEAVRAGRATVSVFGRTIAVGAVEVHAIGGDGEEVDLARSHASMQRTPPDRLGADPFADGGDPDALRFVVVGHAEDLPATLNLVSMSSEGASLDALTDVPLGEVRCRPGTPSGLTCASTRPIRAVADDIDRTHPLVVDRSIKVELGGAIVVASAQRQKLQMIRVGGPRRSPAGAIDRYRATLRMFLVRLAPKGAPPVGRDDAAALALARSEIERANAMWGACGFSFGPPAQADVRVVDPPRAHLLALGCDHGLPASGGTVRLRVEGRDVTAKITRGMRPAAAARVVAAAIARAGFEVRISDNPVMGAGAFGTADVLVRQRGGRLATIEPPARGPVTTDATLTACIGRVELEDGLSHFSDVDAVAGTVEERTLIKAFDDGDPATIEVFLIPTFAGGGRIGESFIAADAGALRNVLIEDRGGIRADRASFTLAHELGHVLLDDPGHPDDWGIDTPTRLMDADAANPSAFGPRRITTAECARALRQSGPGAPVPLLRAWPLMPLGR